MEFQELDSETSELLILDLLSESERSKHGISENLQQFLKSKKVGSRVVNCDSKQEVLQALERASANVDQVCNAIQITAHGNMEGIGNNDGMELITWEELREPLTKINKSCNGELVLNLVACKGIAGFQIAPLIGLCEPFYAIIGATKNLEPVEAHSVCLNFYRYVLEGDEIPIAIKKIIEDFEERIVWVQRAQPIMKKGSG